MTYEPTFAKSSRLVKGLTLFHVLWACYALTIGAGASLNPALGMAYTTYWVGIAHTMNGVYDASCIWVYMAMPFIGALLAAVIFDFHRSTSAQHLGL